MAQATQTESSSLTYLIKTGPASILNRTGSPAPLFFLSQAIAIRNENPRDLSLVPLGQPARKSYLLEALLRFCFNPCKVKIGT